MGRKLRDTRQRISPIRDRLAGPIRTSMTDRLHHDESWVMGVLEPILLLLLMAVIGAFLGQL